MKNTKEIKYSILDLALIAEGKDSAITLNDSLLLAQKAEELGYTRFWLAEHHNSIAIASAATSVLIGYILGGTKKIKVGSGGIMLPNHSPLIIAEQFGTLGALFPDRVDLGLGRAPGTDAATADAIRSDRMRSVLDFPGEIKKLQKYFSADNEDSPVRANVAEGINVPLYVLGSSTDSAHVAAALGLPYAFASHFAPGELHKALAIYHNEFVPSVQLAKPYTMAAANIIVADSSEEAVEMSTTLLRMFRGIFTGNRSYLQAPTAMTEDLKQFAAHPQVQQMIKYTFTGTKAEVKKQTEDFVEQTKIDEIIAVTNVFDADKRVRSYEYFMEIMEEINAEGK